MSTRVDPVESHSDPSGRDRRAEEIAEISPEGRPAHPEFGRATIGLSLALFVIAVLVLALFIAAFLHPIAGVVLGALALLVLLLNPAFWSAILRTNEREKVA